VGIAKVQRIIGGNDFPEQLDNLLSFFGCNFKEPHEREIIQQWKEES
jgi:hypothetical protein